MPVLNEAERLPKACNAFDATSGELDRTTQHRQARRQALADVINAEVEHCRTLFPDAIAFGRWRIVDRSGLEPDRIVYCCRRADQRGWLPDTDAADERLPDGRYRFECRFTAIVEYHPLPADALEKRNATRKRNARKRAIEREKQRMPLLARQIDDDEIRD